MFDPTLIISYKITRFPQNLLIPNVDNDVTIQVTNNSNKQENIRFNFEGEHLNISYELENLTDKIELDPGETKNVDLKLIPTADGYGKLNFNLYWLDIIEYTVKLKKIREKVLKSTSNEIFKKYPIFLNTIEGINRDKYLEKMSMKEIKKIELQLEQQTLEDTDAQIKKLAKGYLVNNNLQKSLDLALKLSNSKERRELYSNLTRVYAVKDINEALETIKNLKDSKAQQKLLEKVALDHISLNPEHSIKIALLIKDPDIKEKTLSNILIKNLETHPNVAFKLVSNIEDTLLKIRLLFKLAKKTYEKNDITELKKLIIQINENLLKSISIYFKEKKFRKEAYSYLKDSINLLAEIENPKAADSIIETIKIEELREQITKDLFELIYEMVDELRTKIEEKLVSSQYFLFNTYASSITKELISFSQLGGNISNNILAHTFDFNIAFLSLFGFNFSIFPLIDRLYNDLKFNLKKSFAYFILPSISNYDQEETNILTRILKHFFKNLERSSSQMLIFNLDFIPYLGTPTIILSSESQINDMLTSKIKILGDKVNLIIDDSMFKGGQIFDTLTQLFPANNCKIINLILSYEFINDYNLFKAFVESLI